MNQELTYPKVDRSWGYYRILYELPGCKVKELVVDPGKSLSMQKHAHRSEYWHVSEGKCVVNYESDQISEYDPSFQEIGKNENIAIPVGKWHQLTNPFDTPCKIIEIQYGEQCDEEDIERKKTALEERLEELRRRDPFIYR